MLRLCMNTTVPITDAQLDLPVNALRKRVGFNVKLTNSFVTQNGLDMLNEIRRERTVEFIDEICAMTISSVEDC